MQPLVVILQNTVTNPVGTDHLFDRWTTLLMLAMFVVLALLLVVGQILKRQPEAGFDQAIIRTFNKRVNTWLTICVLLAVSLLSFGKTVTVVLFGLVSLWALREFITMTPTRRGDHGTLAWLIFVFTPFQYFMVAMNWYDLYTILIPVYASLFIPARIAFTGDHKRFLERSAKIQFGLLICVYALSHAPALLYLELNTYENGNMVPWTGKTSGLLFFFIVIVQVSDMLHFVWDRLAGKHVIAPAVNTTKTWEGVVGSACCTALVGITIQFATPFTWYGAGFMALVISVMASSGSMTMSAIKRDRGVKDCGTLVQGHAGVLDRIDSVLFCCTDLFSRDAVFSPCKLKQIFSSSF